MLHDHQLIAAGLDIDFGPGLAALNEAIDDLRQHVLQPPKAMDPVEWIEANIDLPKSKTERPGKMKLTGYQKEFIRLYFEETTKEIVVTKGARVGMSLLLSALAAYVLAYLGENVTIAQPTDDDALAYYRDRIETLFEYCPALAALRRKPVRGESQDSWNEIHFKNGAVLRLVGAVSDDSFRRYGSKHNWGDEYSAKGWTPSKGSQGDKASLFNERGGEYAHPKLVLISTPLGKDDCRTTERYEESNKSQPWTVCPHCKSEQVMDWGDRDSKSGFKWSKDEHGFVSVCWYLCVNGCEIKRHLDLDFLDANTTYRPGPIWKKPGRVGMHIPQWFSFAGQSDWKNLAQRFLSSIGNPEDMKTWTNNVRGVAHDDLLTSALDGITLASTIRPYPSEVPDDVVVLTAGVDTQTNKEGSAEEQIASREITVAGWTRLGQVRVIGHWIITGAPGESPADAKLTDLLNRKFKNRFGREFPISATAIDLGGHFADEVRAYTSRFPARRSIWAIKGKNNTKGTRLPMVWPKKASKSNKLGAKYYVIDSGLAKDAVFRLIQLRGDYAPMFPPSLKPDYLNKLMCEERKKVNGGWHWQPKRGRRAEEEWACLAYAYAALKGLQHTWGRDWGDLNLAAKALGIADIVHDPETGEIGYGDEDKSAHAIERATEFVALDQIGAPVANLGSQPTRKRTVEEAQPPTATVPSPAVGGMKRKRKSGWTSGTARRW